MRRSLSRIAMPPRAERSGSAVRAAVGLASARRYKLSPTNRSALARNLVGTLGGRFSEEAGIHLDGGRGEIERWFLCATLFGARISSKVALRTYRILSRAGVRTIADAGRSTWDDLVALLDEGGYARYDFRTATRLLKLAKVVGERFPRGIAAVGASARDPEALEVILDGLPGWGPVTVGAFLRELRGIWPAACPPLDERAARAAEHLGLIARATFSGVQRLAARAEVDPRDLEAALVRLAQAHERSYNRCEEVRRTGSPGRSAVAV